MKIALALIVKGDDKEAKLLHRCLTSVAPYVDGIFVTSTFKKGQEPNSSVNSVCAEFDAKVSYFRWTNDFAEARNFNFSQVPKDFDYILWCDADDIFENLPEFRKAIENNKLVDALASWYLYDFDESKNPTVVHKKTQIVKNDGSFKWVGKLHEDLNASREVNIYLVEKVKRIHLSSEERFVENSKRNIEISENDAESNPDDPRVYFNLGNSYLGGGKYKNALQAFKKFIKTSHSEEEIYLARCRMASCQSNLGDREDAILSFQIAIGMMPHYPDAYFRLAELLFDMGRYDSAELYATQGLVKKPPYHSVIVYNPRDYDYNPMNLLAKIYFQKSRPDLALPMLEGCLKIYPNDKRLAELVLEMKKEKDRLQSVVEASVRIGKLTDKNEIIKEINKLPIDLQSHPAICQIRNKHLVKTESSGKDIVYYCGMTTHEWNPISFRTKGVGGSEEAVINLSRQWAKEGYNVTVYNSCGYQEIKSEGVTYKPFWEFNPKDKQDIAILWRSPRAVDADINADKIFVDLHDVVSEGEFTEKRLEKINKIFVKTKAHRVLFPNIPDEKFEIVPNGQDMSLFKGLVEKDPMLLINTSSPDRSLNALPKLFSEVKKQVPEAKCKWAYGWEIFDNAFATDKEKQNWKARIIAEMEAVGIEAVGRLPQSEVAKLYEEGRILAYPSEFYEIDCISVKKAQACGCVPITTDFAAFEESVKYGVKIHSNKDTTNWARPYQFTFGIEDEKMQKEWVDAVVAELRKPMSDNLEMKEWSKQFDWNNISKKWINVLK